MRARSGIETSRVVAYVLSLVCSSDCAAGGLLNTLLLVSPMNDTSERIELGNQEMVLTS
jgi:hypothetical protein